MPHKTRIMLYKHRRERDEFQLGNMCQERLGEEAASEPETVVLQHTDMRWKRREQGQQEIKEGKCGAGLQSATR